MARAWFVVLVTAVFLIRSAASAAASSQPQPKPGPQPIPGRVTVTSNGVPAPNVDIFVFANGVKQPKGTTGAAGTLTLDPIRLELTGITLVEGAPLDVYQLTCRDGKISIVLTPRGTKVSDQDLGCHRRDQPVAPGDDCECDPLAGVLWGSDMRIDVRPPATSPFRGADPDLFTFHVNGGVKFTTFTNADEACATIVVQLTDLRYNQNVVCETDDSGIGGGVGGGLTINVSPNVGIYAGVQYERLGESTHEVDQAGRINVSGSASNLLFSVLNTNTINVFNVDVGVSVGNDWIRVLPYMTYGLASIERTVTDRLLAGPPGTTIPTLQVAGGTATIENDEWGLGGGVRVMVYPGGGPFGVFGQFQLRTINDAFAPDDSGRNPVDFKLRGFLTGIDIRF